MYKVDIQNLRGTKADIISIWEAWSAQLVDIINLWPQDTIYHLRNRTAICLFGMLNKLNVLPRTGVQKFNNTTDIIDIDRNITWPSTMAECFISSKSHYNVYMDLEHAFSITWPKYK